MQRRVLLKLIAAGVVAPQAGSGPLGFVSIASAQTGYQLQFFSQPQHEMVDRLTDIIIPTDDHSPGAHEARVGYFIDVMMSESPDDVRQAWLAGLELVDKQANQQFSRPFLELDRAEQEKIVAAMAAGEADPADELARFFVRLKRMTIDGYYTSKVGIHQDLKYQGNTALSEFPGCDHPEHQA